MCPMSLPQLHIYAKICKKYAKYVSMKFICIICTPHFADVFAQCMQSEPVGLHEGRKAATWKACLGASLDGDESPRSPCVLGQHRWFKRHCSSHSINLKIQAWIPVVENSGFNLFDADNFAACTYRQTSMSWHHGDPLKAGNLCRPLGTSSGSWSLSWCMPLHGRHRSILLHSASICIMAYTYNTPLFTTSQTRGGARAHTHTQQKVQVGSARCLTTAKLNSETVANHHKIKRQWPWNQECIHDSW